jgi:acetyl-CoA acyltransferase
MTKLNDVYVVAYGRSAVGRAIKGSLKNTHPVDIAGQVLRKVLDKIDNLNESEIDDIIIGCSKCEEVQGYNIANLIKMRAGVPYDVPAQTVNRFCSSSLQAIYTGVNLIRVGDADLVVAGGVETMSLLPMGTDITVRNKWLMENEHGAYMPMGITAENVADIYNVSRKDMDKMAMDSHLKAYKAQIEGRFEDQIVPILALDDEGNWNEFIKDEGIRPDSNLEKLASLKPAFKEDGKVTAATSSQMSDGAAMIILMSKAKAKELGVMPIAKFLGYSCVGVDPRVMGIGPIEAVRKILNKLELSIEDIDVIELNEAFAAQAIPVIRATGMNPSHVNINGGAIALGHPLGATGAILTCKALSELKRSGGKYALVTMCIGGGMGAAGVFERV